MKLVSNSFTDGQPIAAQFALCAQDPVEHVTMAANRSPHLAWSGLPEGTRSLVLLCCDPDAPTRPDDVNVDGRTVPATLPRAEFFHWVLVDLPATLRELVAGADSDGVTAGGKSDRAGPSGSRRGLNDYTAWFEGDADMAGKYFGYDGPCPPWNDEIRHRYVFTLYALSVERCPLEGELDGREVRAAIAPHVLAEASITGTYSMNPDIPA